MRIKYLLPVLLFTIFSNTFSQTCGFGCLGLAGVYGGYSVQQYEADGLNNSLNMLLYQADSPYSISDPKFDFKEGRGIKVGINIVRVEYPSYFFTFKGYYQFLSEEQLIELDDGLGYKDRYNTKLEMNNWGFGVDFGVPLFGFLHWKIIEGEVKFFTPKLYLEITNNNPLDNSISFEDTFTADRVNMGYSIGSGLIINIIDKYVSIEATGMYTYLEIEKLTSDVDGIPIPYDNKSGKFISKGGLQGVVQLNLGIPF